MMSKRKYTHMKELETQMLPKWLALTNLKLTDKLKVSTGVFSGQH